MLRIRCKLANASEQINGVAFAPASDGRGMISEPVDADVAQHFARIPGFEVVQPVYDLLAPADPEDEAPTRRTRKQTS